MNKEELKQKFKDVQVTLIGCGDGNPCLIGGSMNEDALNKCLEIVLEYSNQPSKESKINDDILPDFLYRNGNRILIGYNGGSDVTEEWNELLKKMNQSKWISVETPPKHDNNVFAINNGIVEIMAYCNVHEDGETFKVWQMVYDGLQGDPIYDDNYEPTHWQPLPKAP